MHADRFREKSRKRSSSWLNWVRHFVFCCAIDTDLLCEDTYIYIAASQDGRSKAILRWFETGWFCINVETIFKIGKIPCCTPFIASNVCRSRWHPSKDVTSAGRSGWAAKLSHKKHPPSLNDTRGRIIFYEGIVSVLYISSLTSRCCLAVAVCCRCTPLHFVLHLSLPLVLPMISPVPPQAHLFFFSQRQRSLGQSELPFVLVIQDFSFVLVSLFLTPAHVSSFMPSLFKQPEEHLTLTSPPFLRSPSAFYYQPHYLRGNPSPAICSATLPWHLHTGRSCYTIFYCVFTTGHNYY